MVPLSKKSQIGHVQADGLPKVLLVWGHVFFAVR